jgi:hypothetical protein
MQVFISGTYVVILCKIACMFIPRLDLFLLLSLF